MRKLQAAARSAELRLRLGGALRAAALCLPIPLIYALGALTFIKVHQPAPSLEQKLLWFGAIPVALFVLGTVLPFLHRGQRWRGALALDRHHGLKDRITNALTFARAPARSQLMEAAIEDALAHAKELDPRRAVPVRLPKDFLLSGLLALAVYGISLLEVRNVRVEVLPRSADFEVMALAADDVELLREWSRELEKNTEDPEASQAVRRFNQLVEDIAERRLDRRQVFQRLEELEQSLDAASEGQEAALDEGLEGLARELAKSGSTKPIADALEQKRLADAEEAMKELAKRLEQKPSKVNKAELERIRKALEAASKQSVERSAAIEQQRKEVEASRKKLLDKKRDGQKLSQSETQKLADQERQLKRLDRQKQNADAAQQEMSELDRELAKAAAELMKEMGQSAESLEKAAEDLNRMAKKQLSKEEKEALKKQLEELRQLLRQQKQGGKQRNDALERFRQRASGQGQKPGQGQGQGQSGQPGGGKPRIGLGQGQGAGVELPMPGGAAPGSTPGQSGKDGQGQGPGGPEWGTGTTSDIQGEATNPDGRTQDVAAAGIDSGEGEASVEVVYGAAERGFTGRAYRKVYTDYKTVAEEVLTQDEIPPGYKFYVRRYFQLIRPRD